MNQVILLIGLLSVGPETQTISPVSYEQQGPRMATARIRNWISGYKQPGPTVSGSGTLTAVENDEGLVLTAAHLFEQKVGPITVEFFDGQVSGARILAIDRKLDVAALWIFAPKNIRPVPIARKLPHLGEEVEIWGYGPKRFRAFVAKVAEPIPSENDVPDSLVGARGVGEYQVTIPGDSGGPMIQGGRLVAIHWGYRGTETDPRRCVHALGCSKLFEWMSSQLPEGICRRAFDEPSLN